MNDSRRQVVRSTSLIGAASLINIFLSIVRVKIVALTLGAAGVGIIGFYLSFISTASMAASWGLRNTGSRQISQALEAPAALARSRRAVSLAALFLGLAGAAVIIVLRQPLSHWMFRDAASATTIAWLALGVACTVGISAQYALLSGYRRVHDVALTTILSAILVTIGGVGVILLWGSDGILPYVVGGPLLTLFVGHFVVRRLPRPHSSVPLRQILAEWKTLGTLGFAVTVGTSSILLGDFLVRLIVQRELGAGMLGLYHAASVISMTYIGFIFNALAVDFYPRLASAIDDVAATRALVNEQVEVSTLLAAPFLIAMIGFAPLVLHLLYSAEFRDASPMVVWQTFGDVLRIVSWPLAYLLLAQGRGRIYWQSQLLIVATLLLLNLYPVPRFGLAGAGAAYFGMYVCHTTLMVVLARQSLGEIFHDRTTREFKLLASAAALTGAVALAAPPFGMAVGGILALAAAVFASRKLLHLWPDRALRLLAVVPRLRPPKE